MASNVPTAPDFEAMSLEELDDWNLQIKTRIQEWQALYNQSDEPRSRKVAELHLAEAEKQLAVAAEREGRSLPDQAWYWLNDEGAEDPGHRIQAGLWLRANVQKG